MDVSMIFNGERAVILLFIFRVLYASPQSLIYESFALSLMAFAGLFVEISSENSTSLNRFKTRPGASSGILLGAVTLPTVMLSRLIQLSRALSSNDIGTQDFDNLIVQYWAVSATCFSVMFFLSFGLEHSANKTSFFHLLSVQETKVSSFYAVLCVAVCSLSLATRFDSGLHVAMKLLWILSHGLAAVRLIQHILHTFPSCASMGLIELFKTKMLFREIREDFEEISLSEALLVTGGLVLYFGDMLAYTLAKGAYLLSSDLVSVHYGLKRSEISTVTQGVLIGLLLFPMLYKFILRICHHFKIMMDREAHAVIEMTSEGIERSLVFYASLGMALIVIAPAWMQFVHYFQMHPLLWVFNFVFEAPLKRLLLCMYWICVICVSVLRFYNISKNSKIERILLRKYYHLVAVLMFSPALIFQPKFLDLAFGAALAVFLLLEIIRVWKVWPLGKHVHHFMNAFTDHRDSDILIVSHFSLLLGCALPKWLSYGFNDRPLAPFAGILSLGIGDTMASIIGHKYGVLRWSKTGKKTVEGTAAGITSVLAACSVLLPLLASTGSQHWFSLLLAVTASGLLEAYTAQLDNAFIPLVFYSLLCL